MSYNAPSSWYNNHATKSNYIPRPAVIAPQKSQIPGLGYDPSDAYQQQPQVRQQQQQQQQLQQQDFSDEPRLRKQWFQENDLDLYQQQQQGYENYDSKNLNEDEGNYEKMYENYQDEQGTGNTNENSNSDERYVNYPPNDNNDKYIERYEKDQFSPQTEVNSGKPSWLNDDLSHRQNIEKETNRYNATSQQDRGLQRDRLPTPTNQQLHKKFTSNPSLASKSPFAMEYEHKESVMSENNRAFALKKHETEYKSNLAIDNSDYYRNRLKSRKELKSDMSKLLSFGYAGTTDGRVNQRPTENNSGIIKTALPMENKKMGSRENSFSVRFSESTKSGISENYPDPDETRQTPSWYEKSNSNLSMGVNQVAMKSDQLNNNSNYNTSSNSNNGNYRNDYNNNNNSSYSGNRQRKLFNEGDADSSGEKPEFFRLGSSSSTDSRRNASSYGRKKSVDEGRPEFFTNLPSDKHTVYKSPNGDPSLTSIKSSNESEHTSSVGNQPTNNLIMPNLNSSNNSNVNLPVDSDNKNVDDGDEKQRGNVRFNEIPKCRFPKLKNVDLGKPEFFNTGRIYGNSSSCSTDYPTEKLLSRQKPNQSSNDSRLTNFRRRKVDINSSILPTPMKPPMRR